MLLSDVIARIEAVAPLSGAAGWDICGVQIAGLRDDIRTIACCLDGSPASIRAALAPELDADLILTHHPVNFGSPSLARPGNYHEIVRLTLCAGSTLYSAHTSLDANYDGPAGALGRALGMTLETFLEPTAEPSPEYPKGLGVGFVGSLAAPLSLDEIKQRLAPFLPRGFAVGCGPTPATVSRPAYCTGSGGSLIRAAANAGADCYVTGDVKYHQAQEAEELGLYVLDIGHHDIEDDMTRRLAETLAADPALAGLTVVHIPSTDPFHPEPLPTAGTAD